MSIETYEHKGFKIQVTHDEDAQCPREESNVATLACFHKRYGLGDKDHGYDFKDYGSWDEMEAAIRKQENVAVIQPLYLMDHSGLSIRTTPFGCPWDSGQIGFAWITREQAKTVFLRKNMSKKLLADLNKIIVNEVKTYDDYLTGAVYVVSIENPDGDVVEACGGYFGYDSVKEDGYAIKEAKETADILANEWEEAKRVAELPENRKDQLTLGLPGVS